MTEQPLHPDHELVELALGELGEPYRTPLIQHLASCPQCRGEYDDILAAVDITLLAAPPIAPPVGFEQRVLSKIGTLATTEPSPQSPRRRPPGRLLLAAAAVVLAAVTGGAAAVAIWGDNDDAAPELVITADSAALRNSDGEVVGTVAPSSINGQPVLVASIARPPIGVQYHCRVMLEDGRTVDSESWTEDEAGGSTWIIHVPEGKIVEMAVVTKDGRVWSTAQMP